MSKNYEDVTSEEKNTLLEMFDKKLDAIERDPLAIRKAHVRARRMGQISSEHLGLRFG